MHINNAMLVPGQHEPDLRNKTLMPIPACVTNKWHRRAERLTSRDATVTAGSRGHLEGAAAITDWVEGRPKRLDDWDCLTPTTLRRLRNQSTASWVGRRSTWSSTTVALPRSEPTLCAVSIGQHRCFGSKVSFVNTDRWSLESEVCTRVLPGTTAKWWS